MKKALIAIGIIVGTAYACQQNQEEAVSRSEVKHFDVSKYTGNINVDGRMIVGEVSKAFEEMYTTAIEKHGTAGAVDYCAENAFDLLDSLGHYYGVGLKRTSLRIRNPENRPDTLDLAVLNNMQNLGEEGVDLTPMSMKFSGGDGILYAPIKMQPMCLQCHGIKMRGDIKDDVWAKIRERYPEDVAYDYNTNEMRGVWGIYFPAEYWARKGRVDMPEM